MLGKIDASNLKSRDELGEMKNSFNRVDYKVRTILSIFGECTGGKHHFNKFYLDITYTEIGNDENFSYEIVIKYLGNVVYDSVKKIYNTDKSDRWESLLDVIYNCSEATIIGSERVKKLRREGNNK